MNSNLDEWFNLREETLSYVSLILQKGNDFMNYVTLNNGVNIPQLGLGVWKIPNEDVMKAVTQAFEVGYRSIDTASIYQNERGVGEAIRASQIPREDIFVTTKVHNADQGYDRTLRAFEKSMDELGLDYLDLYLIHWPQPAHDQYVETYQALEKLYADGRVRAIGVSNFNIEHLQRLFDECEVKPVLNQVECHPYLQQSELKKFCKQHDIYIESWSPLFQGGEVLKDPVITEIASRHGKTPAQVVIRWHLQEESIVIPKTVTPSRMKENFDVFDFELTFQEMTQIKKLNRNERRGSEPSVMNRR